MDSEYEKMLDEVRKELSHLGVTLPSPQLTTRSILQSIAKIEVEKALNLAMSSSIFRIWDMSGKQLGQYKYLSTFLQEVSFSPNSKYIYAHIQGNRPSLNSVLIWHIDDLDKLLMAGCDRLKFYLSIHPQVRERLKVCWSK